MHYLIDRSLFGTRIVKVNLNSVRSHPQNVLMIFEITNCKQW